MSEKLETYLQNFACNVTWLRKQNGLSKEEMAEVLGTGVKTVNRLERGEVPPRLGMEALSRLANRFDLSAQGLMDRRMGE